MVYYYAVREEDTCREWRRSCLWEERFVRALGSGERHEGGLE